MLKYLFGLLGKTTILKGGFALRKGEWYTWFSCLENAQIAVKMQLKFQNNDS